jgi:hypothetical protein
MPVFSVGSPYPGRRNRAFPERILYAWNGDGHNLTLFLAKPTVREIESARVGKAEFALVVTGPVIWFLSKFGGSLPWSDSPYSIHLEREGSADGIALPPLDLTPAARYLCNIMLIEADTTIVRVIRAVSFSPEFTRALHQAINTQAEQEWPGSAAYDRAIAQAYQRYPSTELLLSFAFAQCVGGEEEKGVV